MVIVVLENPNLEGQLVVTEEKEKKMFLITDVWVVEEGVWVMHHSEDGHQHFSPSRILIETWNP